MDSPPFNAAAAEDPVPFAGVTPQPLDPVASLLRSGADRVLDVGHGSASAAHAIAAQIGGTGRVVGIECDATAIRPGAGGARIARGGAEIRTPRTPNLPVRTSEHGEFDLVIARGLCGSGGRVPAPESWFGQLVDATRLGGTLLSLELDEITLSPTPDVRGFRPLWRMCTAEFRARAVTTHARQRALPDWLREFGLRPSDPKTVLRVVRRGDPRFEAACEGVADLLAATVPALVARGQVDIQTVAQIVEDFAAWRLRADATFRQSLVAVLARRKVGAFFTVTP